MSQRPRLLFVSPRFLFPTNEGGKIRTANILRQMKGGAFEVVLASPTPEGGEQQFASDIAGACDRYLPWPTTPPTRWRRVLALADSVPVSVATDWSDAGSKVIARAVADSPDVVLVDFPHAAVLMPDRIDRPTVLFTHNVEAEIFERHARVATGLMRMVWKDQARKMESFERDACRRFDTVIAVSARDAEALRKRFDLASVERIDTGVDLEFFRWSAPDTAPPAPPDSGTIVFTGVMDSPANIDGVEFLIRDIWPIVLRARPKAKAVIVGRNPAPQLLALARESARDISFTGFVDDIRPYVAAAHVAVIPLRVGSGTRIKAFEAMAMGRPVVATQVGIEGLDIDPGMHFLQADTAPEFAAAILRLLADPALCDQMTRVARARLEERFSWSQVARQFEAICLRAMTQRRVAA